MPDNHNLETSKSHLLTKPWAFRWRRALLVSFYEA